MEPVSNKKEENTCKFRHQSPAMNSIVEDEVHELMIFLDSPGASFQSDLVAAWLSSHISISMEVNEIVCMSLMPWN